MEESLEKSFKFCPVTGLSIPPKDVPAKEKIPHMMKHMEWVSKNSDGLVKDTEPSPLVQVVSEVLAKCPQDKVMRTRQANVQWFREAVQRHGSDRYTALSNLDEHVRDVLSSVGELPVHLPLLEEMATVLQVDGGLETVRDLGGGFPLIGGIPTVPSARQHNVREPLLTEDELRELSPEIFRKAVGESKSTPEADEMSKKVFDQTVEEAELKRMSPLRPVDESDFHRTYPVTRRFPVQQSTSGGALKVRSIDDFLQSKVNSLTSVQARINVGRVSDVVHTSKVLVRHGRQDLVFLKSDFKSAYRTCPIKKEHLKWADVVVQCPVTRMFFMSTQYAMPFGAVGAVYAWDRVADLITTILSILLLLPLSRFVDDIFCCVPREGAAQCRLWMKEIVYLLGFVLDEGKTPLPSSIQTILGVEVRFACVLRRKKRSFSIKVRLDTKKAEHWSRIVQEVLSDGVLSADLSLKMASRFSFVAYAVLGPVGASHIVHLYRRCYDLSSRADRALSRDLLCELSWWEKYLLRNKSRTIRVSPTNVPTAVLYTDAEGRGGTGGVLILDKEVLWFRSDARAAAESVYKLSARKTQIVPYEAIAVKQALSRFSHLLLGRRLLIFVDNQSVLGCLRKGRSRKLDVHHIITDILSVLGTCQIEAVPHWVPSSLNIADVPSRGCPLCFGREVQ